MNLAAVVAARGGAAVEAAAVTHPSRLRRQDADPHRFTPTVPMIFSLPSPAAVQPTRQFTIADGIRDAIVKSPTAPRLRLRR